MWITIPSPSNPRFGKSNIGDPHPCYLICLEFLPIRVEYPKGNVPDGDFSHPYQEIIYAVLEWVTLSLPIDFNWL